jgi:hypothetical protein
VALLGNLEGGSSTRDFERGDEGGSWNGESLSEEAHCGGLLDWGLWVMKGRLWEQASLFMGAQLDNLCWAHIPGTLTDG